MTPLSRFVGRYLPRRLAPLALAAIYTVMLLLIVGNIGYGDGPAIIYLDAD